MQRLYAGLASQVQRNHMGSLGMLKKNIERYAGVCIMRVSIGHDIRETRDENGRGHGDAERR